MSGLFQGLEVGKRALLTHQLTMNTIGHNLANVNTPGYTRQRTNITAAHPLETANYNIGNGVTVTTITRVRDLFLTSQYRRESKSLGEWEYREKALAEIETFFSEPNDESLAGVMDKFWSGWMDLSNDPESSAARSAVVAQANTLSRSFHSLHGQLRQMQNSADMDVVDRIDQINLIADQIANLNRMVVSEEIGGSNANDLRDQRDYKIDQLSKLVDVTTREDANGAMGVFISGLAVVENADSFQLDTMVDTSGETTRHEIVWKNTKSRIKITGGELKGLIETRDKMVPEYMDRLDQMAATIVDRVNEYHRQGTGLDGNSGRNFFDGTCRTADTIKVSRDVLSDNEVIAASLSGEPGDNANALAIAGIRDEEAMSFGTCSVTDFYTTMIGDIGVQSQEAKTFKGNYEVLIQQIENSRESVEGVSLDEEMAEMVRQQHAYEAAARLITYIDDALDTLIHGMGVVGR